MTNWLNDRDVGRTIWSQDDPFGAAPTVWDNDFIFYTTAIWADD